MKETDLYPGIKNYFEGRGFQVQAEVGHIDVCALKDNLLLGIELKLNLSVELLIQGAYRQKLCDLVYIAVPKPKRLRKDRAFVKLLYLLRRLELGLLYVDLDRGEVQEVQAPEFYDLNKARRSLLKQRVGLIAELTGRTFQVNLGGSTKTKLLTTYREAALKAVALLRLQETIAPKDLKTLGLKTTILGDNYYNWFRKLKRGTYALTATAGKDLEPYEEYLAIYQKELAQSRITKA